MNKQYLPEGFYTSAGMQLPISQYALERAMNEGLILESRVTLCDSDMNLHVDLNGIPGIIPKSEVTYLREGEELKDIAVITRVGKHICFKITAIYYNEDGMRLLLSRRAAQEECMTEYIAKLSPGDIIRARVTHLENFGAFADIGCGIVSLLSVDCISVSRISHPRDRLYPGMPIIAVVKSNDVQDGRVYISTRELLGTWEENAAGFKPGQTVAGIIRSVETYGVFVELTPNLAGLAELNQGTAQFINCRPESLIGKTAAVFIKSINPERMKIKLVIVDMYCNDPKAKDEKQNNTAATGLKYFVDHRSITHIDRWQYSPCGAKKLIETVF